MGVYQELEDFDLLFSQLRIQPIVLNGLEQNTREETERVNKLIYTKYTDDLLNNLPSCECGEMAGEYNIDVVCQACHTPVKSPTEQNLDPILWIKAPEGVRALINPTFWSILNARFTRSSYSVIRWLCDTSYQPPVKKPKLMEVVESMGFSRGLNNFVDNFDVIIEKLCNMKAFRLKKGQVDHVVEMIRMFRGRIFCQFMPVPNKSLLVIEETNTATYVDPVVTGAVNAIRNMIGIDSLINGFSRSVKENRTIKAIDMFADFYDGIYKDTFAKKEGIFRKHVYGTRSHFSFRAVISSLTDAHRYDELHIPWGIGISVLRIHLLNKLLRRGYTPNSAFGFLNAHSRKYHPLLDELFQELINEAPQGGIPVVFQRNPSLERGSAQALVITKVKTDVDDPTVGLSILIVKGFNADFDGDQLNGTLSLDYDTWLSLENLAPHMSSLDLNAPRNVATNLSMPKTVVATIANWVSGTI